MNGFYIPNMKKIIYDLSILIKKYISMVLLNALEKYNSNIQIFIRDVEACATYFFIGIKLWMYDSTFYSTKKNNVPDVFVSLTKFLMLHPYFY